jgi:AraC-like DNA-binding protein
MGMPPPERFTFAARDVWLSEFRLPPGHPDWNVARQTADDVFLIAFPRTTVAIRQEHRAEVIADPLSAVVYGPAQPYRRRLISAMGDDCTIIAVLPEVFATFARDLGCDAEAHSSKYRAPFAAVNIDRRAHMTIERIRRLTRDATTLDADAVTEELYDVVGDVVASGYRDTSGRRSRTTARTHRELANAVRDELGRDVSARVPLDDLARMFAVSPFHLARVFRSVTGLPVHAFRTELRLRSSLPLIADGMRLADVAQHVGFVSHAHLTERFVRAYGMTPTAWRQSSKNMEALVEGSLIA